MSRHYRDIEVPTGNELLFRFSARLQDISESMRLQAYSYTDAGTSTKFEDAVNSIQLKINHVQRVLNLDLLHHDDLLKMQKKEQKEEDEEYLCKFTFGDGQKAEMNAEKELKPDTDLDYLFCQNCQKIIKIDENYLDGSILHKNHHNHMPHGTVRCISCFERDTIQEMKDE